MGSTTILNEMGDTTIAWTEDADPFFQALIEKKMAEGVSFFIIERDEDGSATGSQVKVSEKNTITERRVIIRDEDRPKVFGTIPDADIRKAVEEGRATPTKTPRGKVTGSRRTKDPKEAAGASTVAVRPRAGG
jgi:hypothetical protein